MFTGIVEEIGTIRSVTKDSKRFVLDIGCSKVLEGTKEGDSIAVNGVCLTVTTLHMGGFTADVMPETAHRSNISRMSGGTRVNLSGPWRQMAGLADILYLVNVDGMGTIRQVEEDANAVWYTVDALRSFSIISWKKAPSPSTASA